MSHEAEVLLLPGLPLINLAGENPEPDLWTFDVETPSRTEDTSAPAMIDYVHPGDACDRYWRVPRLLLAILIDWFVELGLSTISEWESVFRDKSWRRFTQAEMPVQRELDSSTAPSKIVPVLPVPNNRSCSREEPRDKIVTIAYWSFVMMLFI